LFRSGTPGVIESEEREKRCRVPLSDTTAIMSSTAESVADAEGGGGGGENAIEWISALSTPRRNSTRQAQDRVSQIRTKVP